VSGHELGFTLGNLGHAPARIIRVLLRMNGTDYSGPPGGFVRGSAQAPDDFLYRQHRVAFPIGADLAAELRGPDGSVQLPPDTRLAVDYVDDFGDHQTTWQLFG